MLADFIDDMYPKMNKGAKDAAIAAMDISVVSDQYGKEVSSALRQRHVLCLRQRISVLVGGLRSVDFTTELSASRFGYP
eukprot:50957-Eustigmatos_ZCMA.PRE.1